MYTTHKPNQTDSTKTLCGRSTVTSMGRIGAVVNEARSDCKACASKAQFGKLGRRT